MNGNEYRILGKVKEGKNIVGYVILSTENNTLQIMNLYDTEDLVKRGIISNAKMVNGILTGTQASLNRLPIFNSKGDLISNPSITIMGLFVTGSNNKYYKVIDSYGKSAIANEEQVIKLIIKFGCTNAKLVTKNNKTIVSAILGEFKVIELPEDKRNANSNKQKNKSSNYQIGRYIGKTKVTNSIDIYNRIKLCKELKDKLNTSYNVVKFMYIDRLSRHYTVEINKLLDAIIAGKVGVRLKSHYKNTLDYLFYNGNYTEAANMKFMFKTLKPRVLLDKTNKTIGSGDINVLRVVTKGQLISYLEFLMNFYTDCLKYNRKALIEHNIKKLLKVIKENEDIMKSILNNSECSTMKDIENSILVLCKEKKIEESTLNLMSLIELLNIKSKINNPSLKVKVLNDLNYTLYNIKNNIEMLNRTKGNNFGSVLYNSFLDNQLI